MCGREEGEPARKILRVEAEGAIRKQYERVEDRAPADLIFAERIVEMARANRVFDERERSIVGIPEGRGPIAHEPGKGPWPPPFVRRSHNRHVGRKSGERAVQITNEFRAVVEAAIPYQQRAGRKRKGLRLPGGLFGGVERTIQDAEVVLTVQTGIIRSVRGQHQSRFGDDGGVHRSTITIPDAKLNAHVSHLCPKKTQHLSRIAYSSAVYGLSLTTRPSTSTQA